MASSHAEIFALLRTEVLEMLASSRHSVDDAFAALPEDRIRIQFHYVLEHMQALCSIGEKPWP